MLNAINNRVKLTTMKPEPMFTIFDANGPISQGNKTPVHQAVYTCVIVLYTINLILSAFNLTFGIVCWTVIPKWRRFKHYVYMNLIVASAVNMIGFYLFAHYKFSDIVVVFILLIPRIMMSHWLVVTTVMIYMDIVKGFNNEIKRPYLAANVFSWVVPCVEVLLVYAIDHFFKVAIIVTLNYVMNMALLAVAVIIYFIVVYTVIKLTLSKKGTKKELVSKITLATLFGIPSGVSTLTPILILEMMHTHMVAYDLILILCLLNITTGHVIFITMRSNRELWADYRRKREAINTLKV